MSTPRRRGERGPDKKARKGSPRVGRASGAKMPKTQEPGLKAQRWKAIIMAASGERTRDIAKAVGKTERTINRWLNLPGVSAELAALQEQTVAEARRILKGKAADAAARLALLSAKGRKDQMASVKATTELLDRIGVTKRNEVEVKVSGSLETLPDAELEAIELNAAMELLKQKGWKPPEAS